LIYFGVFFLPHRPTSLRAARAACSAPRPEGGSAASALAAALVSLALVNTVISRRLAAHR